MTATRSDIITNALRILKVVNAGMDAQPDDFALVGKVYDGMHTRMSITNKIWWPNSDCVPDETYGPMSAITAATVITESSDYGLGPQEKGEVLAAADKGQSDLVDIRIAGKVPDGETTPAQYF